MSRLWSSLIEVSSSIEKKEKKAKILGLLIFVSAIGKKKQKKNFRSLKCLWCVLSMKGCIKYSKKDLILKKKKWRIEIQGLLNIHSKPFGLAIRSYLALKRIKPKKSKLQVSNQLFPTHCSVCDTYLWIWFKSLNAYDWN